MRRLIRVLEIIMTGIAVSLSIGGGASALDKKPPLVTYTDDVVPILRQKCFSCHNPDKKSGDLDLTNYSTLMQGGASGPVIEPGDAASSYLYSLVTHESEPAMPPDSPKIPDEMIETIRKWIDGGVLETRDSQASKKKSKSFDLALRDAPTQRPDVAPLPPRLSLEPVLSTSAPTATTAIATSPWAPLTAVAGQMQVLLYSTQTFGLVGVLPFPEGVPEVLKFSRNGSLLLAGGGQGGARGRVVVWNVTTGERVFEIGDELDTVLAADISSDQTLIALGGPQKVVRIYSTESGQLLHELRKHTDWICSLEFSPDSVLLATCDRNGGLQVWEGWTGREYLMLTGHTASVTDVSWRSDSNLLASSSEDGTIRLWEMENGTEVKGWAAHSGGTASVDFTRDSRLVSCGRDRIAKLWDQNGGQQLAFEPFNDLALEVAWCAETDRLVAGDWAGTIRVWNAADGARLAELSSNPPSLAERLQTATLLLTTRQTEYKPSADALAAAQGGLDKAQADRAATEKLAVELQAALDADLLARATETQVLQTAATEHETVAATLATLEHVVPALETAVEKTQEAATKMNDVPEIVEAASTFKSVTEARKKLLAVAKESMPAKLKTLNLAKEKVAATETRIKTTQSALSSANETMAQLKALIPALEQQVAAAKPPAESAHAALVVASQEVDRWSAEIAFTKQLLQLTAQRDELTEQLAGHQEIQAVRSQEVQRVATDLQQSQANINAVQAILAEARQKSDEIAAQVQTAKLDIESATVGYDAAQVSVKTLDTILPPLAESAANMAQAAKSGGDVQDLVEASNLVNGLLAKKQQQLATAMTEQKSAVEKLNAAKQRMAATEKLQHDSAMVLQTAEQQVAEKQETLNALNTVLSTAQQALVTAEALTEEIQNNLNQLELQLAALKQFNSSSQ